MKKPVIYTVGHSNRPFAEFLALLRAHGVRRLVDIRTVPKSRHNPQFNENALRKALKRARISYAREAGLGGLRRAAKDSKNGGWANASFRGYADYMSTSAFAAALEALMKSARTRPTAVMCAEAVPWRCHRSLVADALTVRGWDVRHIMSRTSAKKHHRTPFLRVRNGVCTYPPTAATKRYARAYAAKRAASHA